MRTPRGMSPTGHWRGVDFDDFQISSTPLVDPTGPVSGVQVSLITLQLQAEAPDYREIRPTANGDSIYKVTLVATDSQGRQGYSRGR